MDYFSQYLHTIKLSAREPEIRGLIAQGAEDVRAILCQPWGADEVLSYVRREISAAEHARQVTGIMWYLTSIAVERNQTFRAGAFVCRDPHGRLSAYFRGIGRLRTSSHLKRQSASGCTGGVDLFAGEDDLPPLANGHRHVLYIAILHDERRGSCLFLKPEHYGVSSLSDLTHHAVRYAKSLVRRYFVHGGNEIVGMRKERIPDQFVRDFRNAVAKLPDGPSAIAEVGCRGDGEGIGYMHEYLTDKVDDVTLSESDRDLLLAILLRLRSEYDFVALRFGNEVFLDLPADISGDLPQAPGVYGPSRSLQELGSYSGEETRELGTPLMGIVYVPSRISDQSVSKESTQATLDKIQG
ncbi:uncharacterized protein GGS25DRAFT_64238 [Hypoxylon fragiforme]|uniref:uncharacterized protein n=1 Tax=Hypoxylon fragiforme TaxID=63214 RepID=UPI0020C703AB|nr:uncharacterized protein GGS25DRAFT_64238 [Hypoxylon fragiforme]KAI2614736.1 hypothetical protein GGS25DRAFT_64238 [Hypoxylon fragiforme]